MKRDCGQCCWLLMRPLLMRILYQKLAPCYSIHQLLTCCCSRLQTVTAAELLAAENFDEDLFEALRQVYSPQATGCSVLLLKDLKIAAPYPVADGPLLRGSLLIPPHCSLCAHQCLCKQ